MVNGWLKSPLSGSDEAQRAHFRHETCVNQQMLGAEKSFWIKRFLV
jgi:hypothetical protein